MQELIIRGQDDEAMLDEATHGKVAHDKVGKAVLGKVARGKAVLGKATHSKAGKAMLDEVAHGTASGAILFKIHARIGMWCRRTGMAFQEVSHPKSNRFKNCYG